jgi:hypothetical protein
MDNKKFEQLIDLIINENEEQARALFHDIVVEKSREIYESMMMDEMGMHSPVDNLLDEISAEEEGMTEEDEMDIEMDGSGDEEAEIDLDADEMDGMDGDEGDLEDRVVDLEDKLDELMAEFEELMGNEADDDMGDEDFGDDEDTNMMESSDDDEEEDVTEAKEEDEEEEETLEEAVQLQKVSVTHGDNGQNTKSPVSGGPKVSGNGASAANIAKGGDGGKGGTQGGLLNPTSKDLPGAGKFKNAPGAGKFNEKGEAAPKPKHGDDGSNAKSPVAESKKSVKKIIKK